MSRKIIFVTIGVLFSLTACTVGDQFQIRTVGNPDAIVTLNQNGGSPNKVTSLDKLPDPKSFFSIVGAGSGSPGRLLTASDWKKWTTPTLPEVDDMFWGGFLAQSASKPVFTLEEKILFWGHKAGAPAGGYACYNAFVMDEAMRSLTESTYNPCILGKVASTPGVSILGSSPEKVFLQSEEDRTMRLQVVGQGNFPFYPDQLIKISGTKNLSEGEFLAQSYVCENSKVTYRSSSRFKPGPASNEASLESTGAWFSSIGEFYPRTLPPLKADSAGNWILDDSKPRVGQTCGDEPINKGGWGSAKIEFQIDKNQYSFRRLDVNTLGQYGNYSHGQLFDGYVLGDRIDKLIKDVVNSNRALNLGSSSYFTQARYSAQNEFGRYMNLADPNKIAQAATVDLGADPFFGNPKMEIPAPVDLSCSPKIDATIILSSETPEAQSITYACTMDIDYSKVNFCKYPEILAASEKSR